jgi:hypothetical protein
MKLPILFQMYRVAFPRNASVLQKMKEEYDDLDTRLNEAIQQVREKYGDLDD